MKFKNSSSNFNSGCLPLCTSCGTPELKHDTLVYQAREDYATLDSAKVVITNEDTGDIEQEFTFKYDERMC